MHAHVVKKAATAGHGAQTQEPKGYGMATDATRQMMTAHRPQKSQGKKVAHTLKVRVSKCRREMRQAYPVGGHTSNWEEAIPT